jgi:hypothetical protein
MREIAIRSDFSGWIAVEVRNFDAVFHDLSPGTRFATLRATKATSIVRAAR